MTFSTLTWLVPLLPLGGFVVNFSASRFWIYRQRKP